MNNTDILNVFEGKIKSKIIDFCNKVNASQADLYIVMARKAACFINALEAFSMVSISGKVISERLLDTNINWSNIRRIVIIDDVIISGTTLNRTIEKIKNANHLIEIKVFVLGINEKWFNSKLLENEQNISYLETPIKPLTNSQCIRLSGDIVKMLAMIPTPYNIDYPIYNTIKLKDEDYERVLNMAGWEVSEVTSCLQNKNNIFTNTFFPSKNILNYCGNLFSNDLINDSLLKIRIYGRSNIDKKKEMHSFSIVPMAILPPLSIDQIEILFKHLSSHKYNILSLFLNSATSKLRFIQFVIADRLANIFIQEVDYYTDNNTSIIREFNSLRFLFPEEIIRDIIEIADEQLLDININYNKSDIRPKNISSPYNATDFVSINNTLNYPFLDMYYKYEIPARKLALKYGKDVFKKEEYVSVIGRLNKGYSLLDLTNLLRIYSYDIQIRLVSAFLDKAVDNGIAVPITVVENGVVYRAFRHGEDVQFGQREERLCFEMFNAFNEQIEKEEWQKLWVEKMMVLFLKIGENRFLDPIQTDITNYKHINGNSNPNIAGIRYYLQGPIVVKVSSESFSYNPCLEYGDKAKWLSRDLLLLPKSPLKKIKNNMFGFDSASFFQQNYTNDDNEIIIDKDMIKNAVEIGYVFGLLIKNSTIKKVPFLTTDDLVALSCCLEPKDAIGALAAEINLSYKAYKEGFKTIKPINEILNAMNRKEILIEDGLKMLHQSILYQALNDGQRKFNWYIKKYPHEVINRVKCDFTNVMLRNQWDSFWSPNIDWTEESEDQKKLDLAKIEGLWLLCANIYLSMIEYYFYFISNNHKMINALNKKIDKLYQDLQPFVAHSRAREIVPFINTFRSKKNDPKYIDLLFDQTVKRIDILLASVNNIIKDACDFYNSFAKIPDINYFNAAIYVETEDLKSLKRVDNLFKSICFRVTKTASRTNAILKDLPKYASNIKGQRGEWYVASGGDAEFWLLQFAAEIMNVLNGKDNYKIFYFPTLPDVCKIKVIDKHNFSYNVFWELIYSVATYIEAAHFQNNILYVIRDARISKTIIEENNKLKDFVVQTYNEVDTRLPNKMKFNIVKYKNSNIIMDKKKFNIGILTIVTEEAQAVLSEFGCEKKAIKQGNRFFDEFEYNINESNLKIVHLQSTNPGNLQIINAYHALINHYSLDYVVLLGIAGSIQEKIKLCDVIIGTNIIYYEKRKDIGQNMCQRRGEFFNISFNLTQHLNRFFVSHSEPAQFISDEESVQETFHVHRGPIGSGEAVIADSLSEIKKWLLDVHSKTGVVETEAAGFFQAYYETNNIETEVEDKVVNDVLVIRGISDHADFEKNDKWRLPASKNAVLTLKKILEILY